MPCCLGTKLFLNSRSLKQRCRNEFLGAGGIVVLHRIYASVHSMVAHRIGLERVEQF